MSVNNSSWDYQNFREQIQICLSSFIDKQADYAQLGPDAAAILASAREAVSGGKRLRAAFCYWGYAGIAGTSQTVLPACAALELLHASALVHDDLIDASELRRGNPATHTAYTQRHRDNNWPGAPAQYGAAAAILLGDLLLSWADELLRDTQLPLPQIWAGLKIFDHTRTEVALGQFLDVSVQARGSANVTEAMQVVRYKSAKYSIERPLQLGAALAGANQTIQTQLSKFGLPLGEAFQLRDDLLGVFGDPEITGKPAGDDLSEGKRTVLIALALDGLPAAAANQLHQKLGTKLSEAEIEELQNLITQSGAKDQVEAAIVELTQQANAALQVAEISAAAKASLTQLATLATQRTG